MYNRDVLGTRHNPAETALSRSTVGRLVRGDARLVWLDYNTGKEVLR
jgi:hypothetical protein